MEPGDDRRAELRGPQHPDERRGVPEGMLGLLQTVGLIGHRLIRRHGLHVGQRYSVAAACAARTPGPELQVRGQAWWVEVVLGNSEPLAAPDDLAPAL